MVGRESRIQEAARFNALMPGCPVGKSAGNNITAYLWPLAPCPQPPPLSFAIPVTVAIPVAAAVAIAIAAAVAVAVAVSVAAAASMLAVGRGHLLTAMVHNHGCTPVIECLVVVSNGLYVRRDILQIGCAGRCGLAGGWVG